MDFYTAAIVLGIIGFGVVVIREVSHTTQVRLRSQIQMYREKNQAIKVEEMLSQVDQIPFIIEEMTRMKLEMQAKGAKAEELKPLDDRRNMLEGVYKTVKPFEPWIRMGGPVINRLIKWGLKLLG